jgi:nucleotide-binding universal stress UspA family protein
LTDADPPGADREAIMKNVLLLVHHDAGQEARLQAALDVTRALEGHLICLDVIQVPVLLDDFQSGAATSLLLDDEREREATNSREIEQRLAGEGVTWELHVTVGDLGNAVADAAAMADLIVVNRKLDASPGPDMRDVAGTILMRTGKPVLAVPDSLRQFEAAGRALVAWDGSASATAAMRASVPLLKLASDVRLFSVCRDGEDVDLGEAASYLSRHGVHPELFQVHSGRGAVHQRILDECVSWGAAWCVMGAYGHGRLRETLFGGVTREMLGNCNLPLVLGH